MKRDWGLFAGILLIVAVGLTTLYSTVVGEENILFGGGIFNKQLIFVMIGFVIYFAVSYADYRVLQHPQVFTVMFVITVLLLVYLLLFGVEIHNSKRWVMIAGGQFQVSEIAKIVVIFLTSGIMSLKDRHNPYKLAIISLCMTLLIVVLVFLEPDAGTSLVTFGIWAMMVFTSLPNQILNLGFLLVILLAGIGMNFLLISNFLFALVCLSTSLIIGIVIFIKNGNLKWLVVGFFVGGLLFGLFVNYGWNHILHDYQRQRIETFLDPEEDVQGSGFQVTQSKVAIGSGMLFGKGFGHGTQSKLNFLPEHQTDFIFAAFSEEFGLVGSLFLIGLYAFVIFRIFSISRKSSDYFGSIICVGVGIKLLLEVFINIGMNIGVVPATGVPLPLMSAGGSIFLVTMLALGLVQSVYVRKDEF